MPSREAVDEVVKDLLAQVPGLDVHRITLMPTEPVEGRDVIARIDFVGSGSVICTISADGRLQSAHVQSA